MSEFMIRHKVLLLLLSVIFSAFYLFAALYPGYWYHDAFLYKQKDGSFAGSGSHGQYALYIDGSTITMSINGVTHTYEVQKSDDTVRILKDGEEIFFGIDRDGHLWNADGSIASGTSSVFSANAAYTTEELFPNTGGIYGLSKPQAADTRGNAWTLALAWLLAGVLIVDVLFPDVWFRIRFWGLVEDGHPGERYRMGQYFSRILYPIFIVFVLFMGFFH